MKKISSLIAATLMVLVGISSLTSCGDDGPDVCAASDYNGSFVGKHWLLNLIPLDDNDTINVTTNGNTIALTSALLQTTFNATYNEATGEASVSNIDFDEFIIGNDTLFDISVSNGIVELDASCNNIFISLEGVSVQSGTISLPSSLGLSYPLTNAKINTKNGLIRQ